MKIKNKTLTTRQTYLLILIIIIPLGLFFTINTNGNLAQEDPSTPPFLTPGGDIRTLPPELLASLSPVPTGGINPLVNSPPQQCALTTYLAGVRVRISAYPSLEAPFVGVINSNEWYPVIQKFEVKNNNVVVEEWYQIEEGWLRGEINGIRYAILSNSNCNDSLLIIQTPTPTFSPTPTPTSSMFVTPISTPSTPVPPTTFLLPIDSLGTFLAKEGDRDFDQIYVIKAGEVSQITDTPINKTYPTLSPSGKLLTFISVSQTEAGQLLTLQLINLVNNETSILFEETNDLKLGNYSPNWLPDESGLLITLINSLGIPNIYQLDHLNPTEPPQLIIKDAMSPVYSSDGELILFERKNEAEKRSIYVWLVSNGQEQLLSGELEGKDCFNPSFDFIVRLVYFVCDDQSDSQTIYLSDASDQITPLFTARIINNLSPVGERFLTFDDGEVFYLGNISGDFDLIINAQVLSPVFGMVVTNLKWTSPVEPN